MIISPVQSKALAAALVCLGLSGCKLEDHMRGVFGPAGSQKWEYKVVYFDRDSHEEFDAMLRTAGEERWQYAGPLCNDGVNAQFIAFKRLK
jgi:hypothetical protein